MVKKMLFFLIMISFILSCSSYQKVDTPKREVVKINEVDLSKDDIYNRSLQFIAENFKSAKAVIEYKDKESGRIIGNGSLMISDGIMQRPASFTMVIDIKEKKYRIIYKNLLYRPGTKMPWKPIDYAGPYNSMMKSLDELTIRFNDYLSKANENKDF